MTLESHSSGRPIRAATLGSTRTVPGLRTIHSAIRRFDDGFLDRLVDSEQTTSGLVQRPIRAAPATRSKLRMEKRCDASALLRLAWRLRSVCCRLVPMLSQMIRRRPGSVPPSLAMPPSQAETKYRPTRASNKDALHSTCASTSFKTSKGRGLCANVSSPGNRLGVSIDRPEIGVGPGEDPTCSNWDSRSLLA